MMYMCTMCILYIVYIDLNKYHLSFIFIILLFFIYHMSFVLNIT